MSSPRPAAFVERKNERIANCLLIWAPELPHREFKHASLGLFARRPNEPPMSFDDCAANGQANTCTLALRGKKRFKHALCLHGIESPAEVFDGDHGELVVDRRAYSHQQRTHD